jgi:hypothetical protein
MRYHAATNTAETYCGALLLRSLGAAISQASFPHETTEGNIALRMYQKENHSASQNSKPIAPVLGVRENVWAMMFPSSHSSHCCEHSPFFATNAKLSLTRIDEFVFSCSDNSNLAQTVPSCGGGGDGTSDAVNYPNARSRVNYVTKSQCFDGEVPYILFVEVRVPPRQKKNTM